MRITSLELVFNNHQVNVSCATNNIKTGQYSKSYEDRFNHLQVTVPLETDLSYGMCFETINQQPIENKYNNKSSFDYHRYMKSKMIIAEAEGEQLVASRGNIVTKIKNVRMQLIDRNCENAEVICPYVNALVFGEKGIDDSNLNTYGQIGIAALFVISGMHISVIYEFLMYYLAKLRVVENHGIAISLGIISVYSLLAGASVAVNRAVIMIILSRGFKLQHSHSLVVSFLIAFFYNPFNLLNKGFVISYIITGLIIFLPKRLYQDKKYVAIHFSYLCYLIILPLTYSFSYTVNLLAPIAMLIFTPLVMTLLLALSICITIYPSSVLIEVTDVVINFINGLAGLFDQFTIVSGHVSFIMWIIYFGIVSMYIYYENRNCLYLLIIWFILICLNLQLYPSVTFIDVSQGDSALVKSKHGNYLVDVGNAPKEVWKQVHYEGVNTIDGVFISHAHLDHYGSISEISNYLNIENVYELAGNQIVANSIGVSNDFTNEYIEVIPYYGSNDNDRELIVKFKLGKFSILFPGDVEAESEQYLVDNYCSELKSNILKVPHHGSKTSSSVDFVDCVDPDIAIISSGKNNRYGHPNYEIVKRYEERATLYDTQDVGEIKFKFKSNNMKKST